MKRNLWRKILALGVLLMFVELAVMPIDAGEKTSLYKVSQTSIENYTYKLLIITPVKFEKELERLVAHKEKIGVSTKLVTLDEIYEETQGRDEAEKIKYFIKKALEEWETRYVLLVGGKKGQLPIWHLPVRYVQMDVGWESRYISDLYYADIYDSEGSFSSWDTDGDGLYSEWVYGKKPEDKGLDLYPDVAVGRLPCRNILEVRIMVNKIIYYETYTYGKNWFYDMIVIAGDTYPESHNPRWKGYEGEYYAELALENMTGFNPVKLYTSDGTFSGENDVIDAISKGCGFVYFVGHGNPRTWGTHPPDSSEFIKGLTVQKMHKLKNKHMYPVCVVSGCHNNQFDVSILKFISIISRYRGEATFECWGWRMTRKIDGGSIATIGCTALGFTKEDKRSFKGGINEIEVEFFKQYRQNNFTIVGDTWAAAVSAYIDKYPVVWSAKPDMWIDAQVVQSWILLGDPSLQIGGYP
jgi:hypothetical protein